MKRELLTLTLLTSITAASTAVALNEAGELPPSCQCETDICYNVGDIGPAGGIVIQVVMPECTSGIEAAPSDLSLKAWGCVGISVPEAQTGNGEISTQAIADTCDANPAEAENAAELTLEYSHTHAGEVFDDWHLPSVSELYVLCEESHRFDNTDGIDPVLAQSYWSSTERNIHYAKRVYMGNCINYSHRKKSPLNIRPVRSF